MAALEQHTTAGRLSLDEFSERVSLVYAAATQAELARLTDDLPADPLALTPSGVPDHRQMIFAFLLALLTIVVLAVILAVAR